MVGATHKGGTQCNYTNSKKPAPTGSWHGSARLIAAAPDLLAALEACVPDLERYVSTHGPGPDRRLDAARAAIAKARGE